MCDGFNLIAHHMVFYCCHSDISIIVGITLLTLKVPNKNCSRRHFDFYFYLSKKTRLDFSCEMIHLKHQVLFSLKNNEKIFMNVVCCSLDWRFKG